METLIGYFGSVLLIAAWINEVYRLHKTTNVEAMSLKFLFIYLVSSIALFIHAITVQDMVFESMQFVLTIITLIEIDIVMRKKSKMKTTRK
jgi:lipid-A-disaccharide synthase-like uncharacterized protein